MFEQAFKNIDDVLWKEAGCTTELDYTEQTSWLLFLKYLDGLEQDKALEAEMEGRKYYFILEEPYRWESWAAPKTKDGQLDHNQALTGDDLRDFVDRKLFPYLHGFKQRAGGPNTIEYKIGQIFGEIKNKIHSGYNLRVIIDHIDELRFRSQTEKHELSHLYEAKIKNMGVDLVLSAVPNGGKERKEVQHNFPIRTGETAFLFLQHFLKILRAGGRGGVVLKNTFLSNTDNASVSLRKLLLESCNLHTVIDCPASTYQGSGVKNVVLFFENGAQTQPVWHYQLDPCRNLGKTNPLNDADLAEFVELQPTFADSPKSWSVDMADIDKTTFDLSVKNPNGGEAVTHRSPQDIMDEIAALDAESAEVLGNIQKLLTRPLTTVRPERSKPRFAWHGVAKKQPCFSLFDEFSVVGKLMILLPQKSCFLRACRRAGFDKLNPNGIQELMIGLIISGAAHE